MSHPDTGATKAPLLQVRGLTVRYPAGRGAQRGGGFIQAVSGVDLDVAPGETLGLVGESGCGKTTTGRAILQLVRPHAGSVRFEGVELCGLPESALRGVRRRLQIVFQDPYASLDPRMTVGEIVGEPLAIHGLGAPSGRRAGRAERAERVAALLERCGLDPDVAHRYPHAFSGGQRQRIGIARALACEPRLLVCDEPVSALDVSVQAQILNLLDDLRAERGLAYLFVAHDLAAVRHVSHRVAVMYLGRIVEQAPAAELFERPLHPYTQALLAAVPIPDPRREAARLRDRRPLGGEPPSPISPPTGCAFHPRCPLRAALPPALAARCAEGVPALEPVGEGALARAVACHAVERPSA